MTGGFATGFVLVFFFAVVVVIVGVVGLLLKVGSLLLRGLFGSAPASASRVRYNTCSAARCGFENRPTARFCAQCGNRLPERSGTPE